MRYVLLFLVTLFSSNLYADQQDLYEAARAYQQGEFGKSAILYRDVLTEDHVNGSILFNLGNAYFKDGKTGEAIASYISAASYIPRDADLKANLKYALTKTKDKESGDLMADRFEVSTLSHLLNQRELLTATGLIWFSGFLLLACYFWWSTTKPILYSAIFLVVFSALGGTLAFYRHATYTLIGSISDPQVNVYASPSEKNSTVVFKLHEGTLVKYIEQQVDWVAIELADQKRGWVKSAQVSFLP